MQPDATKDIPPSSDGGLIGEARRQFEMINNLAHDQSGELDDAVRKLPEPIGPYRPIRVLGKGGMGIVYLAEQTQPIRRRVALKLIKVGMDTDQYVKRFEAERQALAMMNHVNVAKVFDAGATATGRPYFVMEYVEGVPITGYCDRNHLTIEERLKLFVKVCEGVQHAHQKGIIHRDLKPSNVLVELRDGQPAPKVIDFGLAKTFEQPLTEQSLHTHHDHAPGTPGYMSPEQAGGGSVDIDTRTDVYSLGVLAYELLVGVLPHDVKELERADVQERLRIIREVDPPTPSTRITSPADDMPAVAERRNTSRNALIRILRNDLDWIVMKCLEKDRARRYATANALAMDVQRYLNREPVVARPPSAMYRLKKLVRRNLATVAAIGLVLLGTTGGMFWALHERGKANTERDKTVKFAEFMEETIKGVGPSVALGRNAEMLKEMMDAAAKRIEAGELKASPEAELRLRLTIGAVYREIAKFEAAGHMLTPSIKLAETVHGRDSAERASALMEYAEWLKSLGRSAEALPLYEESLVLRKQIFTGDHRDVALSLDKVASCLDSLARFAEALPKHEEALAMARRLSPGDHPDVSRTLSNTAGCLNQLGRVAEALPRFEEALSMRQRLGPGDDPNLAADLSNVAFCLNDLGHSIEALPKFEESLSISNRLFLDDHPDVAKSIENVATCLQSLGRYTEALPKYEEAVAMYQRLFPGDHPDVASGLNNVAFCLKSLSRLTEAMAKYEEGLAMAHRVFSGDHPIVTNSLNGVASCLRSLGRPAEALPKYEEVLAMSLRLFPGDHPDVASSLNNVAGCLEYLGRSSEALPKYEEALAMRQRLYPGDHPDVATSLNNIAGCLRSLRRMTDSLIMHEESLGMYRRLFPGDHPNVANSLNGVASCLRSLGRFTDALPVYEESLAVVKRLFPGDHDDVANSIGHVANCLKSLGRSEEALPKYEESLAMYKRLFPGDHPKVATSLNNLASCLKSLDRSADALPHYEEALTMRRHLVSNDDPETEIFLSNVAGCLETLGRFEEAILKYEEALAMFQRLNESDHAQVAFSLGNIARCLQQLGRFAEALPKYDRALAIFSRKLPPDHWAMRVTEIGKGATLVGLERFQEAESLLAPTWENITDRTDVPTRHKVRCLEALVKLHTALDLANPGNGHDVKATEWQAKLDGLSLTSERPPNP